MWNRISCVLVFGFVSVCLSLQVSTCEAQFHQRAYSQNFDSRSTNQRAFWNNYYGMNPYSWNSHYRVPPPCPRRTVSAIPMPIEIPSIPAMPIQPQIISEPVQPVLSNPSAEISKAQVDVQPESTEHPATINNGELEASLEAADSVVQEISNSDASSEEMIGQSSLSDVPLTAPSDMNDRASEAAKEIEMLNMKLADEQAKSAESEKQLLEATLKARKMEERVRAAERRLRSLQEQAIAQQQKAKESAKVARDVMAKLEKQMQEAKQEKSKQQAKKKKANKPKKETSLEKQIASLNSRRDRQLKTQVERLEKKIEKRISELDKDSKNYEKLKSRITKSRDKDIEALKAKINKRYDDQIEKLKGKR